jgi:hypothetical protein
MILMLSSGCAHQPETTIPAGLQRHLQRVRNKKAELSCAAPIALN